MYSRRLITVVSVLLCVWTTAEAQGKYANLDKWVGKTPTYDKSFGNFFRLPEVWRPLKKLLSEKDFYYLTRGHTKETPFKLVENYLHTEMCGERGSYACDYHTLFVVNLADGSMNVAFDVFSDKPRCYSTKGKFTDLPRKVLSIGPGVEFSKPCAQ